MRLRVLGVAGEGDPLLNIHLMKLVFRHHADPIDIPTGVVNLLEVDGLNDLPDKVVIPLRPPPPLFCGDIGEQVFREALPRWCIYVIGPEIRDVLRQLNLRRKWPETG